MHNISESIVIVGATSSIAEHCARIWLQQGAQRLVLVGRDLARLEPLAADLRVRAPQADIHVVRADFIHAASVQQTVNDIVALGGVPQQVLVAHGSLPEQAGCQRDLEQAGDALQINGISPVLFAEAFAGHMEKANAGTLAIIGSVAGERGRKSNYVYGAAKGLVTRYAEGLQHRLAATAVRVVLVKPGPTDTPMTASLKSKGAKLAPVADVAQAIVQGMQLGHAEVYAPAKWRLIMLVIRNLPRFVFNKMDI